MRSSDTIFLNARELEDPAERARYVAEACEADAALRARVDEMLLAAEEAGGYFAGESTSWDKDPRPREGPGTVIGRYRLLEKIGEGGMGVVYLAEQREPVARRVALKVIKLGMDTKAVVARFEAERQALALMDHPNIAKVFDGGATETGRPYFVMELVKGVPITEYCKTNQTGTEERLQLFIQTCQAIQHAHQKGVIHRDIKPSNILVTMQDGGAVPKVIDFGIAKATQQQLTEKTLFTQLQQVVGTPAYMSPEQAEMTSLDIDTRTDIYSLGVLLYELLTGATPFDAKELLSAGLDEMRRIIREKDPVRPSTRLSRSVGGTLNTPRPKHPVASSLSTPASASKQVTRWNATELFGRLSVPRPVPGTNHDLISALRGDLDWIVMKCLEKDRTRRYETANGLGMDIQRFLRHEAVDARPPTAMYRLKKVAARNRSAFAAGLAVAGALLLGLGLTIWQSAARKEALVEARRTLYVAQMQAVQDAWTRGDIKRARSLLRAQIPKHGEEDLRGFEWRHFWKLCRDGSTLNIPHEFEKPMFSVAVSPDGSLLATGDESGQITLRRTTDWMVVNESMRHLKEVRSLKFASDGLSLVSAGNRTVRIWDVATGREKVSFDFIKGSAGISSHAQFSPNGELIAAGGSGGIVHVWDARTGELVATFERLHDTFRSLDFSPDGSALVFSNGDSVIHIWDSRSRTPAREIPTRHHVVGALKYSPDGRVLASSGSDGLIQLWSTDDWAEAGTLAGHDNTVTALSFSPDGRTLASACIDSTIKIWDLASRSEIESLYGHAMRVEDLAFFPDGHRVASVGDSTLKIWEVPERKDEPNFARDPVISGEAAYTRFSPDGRVFVTVGVDDPSERRVWDADSGRLVARLSGARAGNSSAAAGEFSADSRFFASPGQNNGVLVWNTTKWDLEVQLTTGTNQIDALTFSAKGELFASASSEATIRRWSASSFGSSAPLSGYEGGVSGLRFSPDGSILAAWCRDGNIRLLEISSGTFLHPVYHTQPYPDMAFSPDSKLLAVSSSEAIGLWDVRAGEQIAVLEGKRAAFSPNGEMLALSTAGATIQLWDLKEKRMAGELKWQGGWSGSMAFSPDGRTLVSSDSYVTLRIWSVKMLREVITLSPKGGARMHFSPDGNTLLVLNHWRENKLLKASSFAEAERELADEPSKEKEAYE